MKDAMDARFESQTVMIEGVVEGEACRSWMQQVPTRTGAEAKPIRSRWVEEHITSAMLGELW